MSFFGTLGFLFYTYQVKVRKEKVFIGLSGGVDSSVSALLLKQKGFDVEGVFIRTWQPDWTPCTWRQDRRDAMRVCAKLNIKFNEIDLEETYKKEVADYMIREYKEGRTPNPDVMCNRTVKFGGFLKWAIKNGGDYVATGHYAQVFDMEGLLVLGRGIDKKKDQSYFLWTLRSEQLDRVVFPIGHLEKTEVRRIAKKNNLITAEKKDSQGICFLGDIDMQDFLRHYIEEKPGIVLDSSGQEIGTHRGALFFTLGQRHGFVINKKGVDDGPRYVVAKDIDKNTITVGKSVAPVLSKRLVHLREVNFIVRDSFKIGSKLEAEIRYHGTIQYCKVVGVSLDSLQIEFEKHDPTLSSGQSVVFYNGNVCLGGGVVK